jgi:hypothetical protein
MTAALTNWQKRFNKAKTPVVKQLDVDFAGIKRGTMMLVSSPHEIDAYIRSIPEGESRSVEQMRDALAQQHNAEATCPASTAIFLRVVSELAFEELQAGKPLDTITPFWRVVEPGSRLAKKLSCGDEFLQSMRKGEHL